MGDKADQIERHIDYQRRELRDNIAELKQKAAQTFDWRSQCEARPLTMIGIAFGGGVLLSGLLDRRRSVPHETEPMTASRRHSGALAGTLHQIKGVLLTLAATKLGTAVDALLPGFQEAYKKAEAAYTSR